jgi:hypothetical protein
MVPFLFLDGEVGEIKLIYSMPAIVAIYPMLGQNDYQSLVCIFTHYLCMYLNPKSLEMNTSQLSVPLLI